MRRSSLGERGHSLSERRHSPGGSHHGDLSFPRPTGQDPMQAGCTQQSVEAGRDIDENESATHAMRAMMDADNHPEPSGVMDLGIGQMDQQVTRSPIQD